MSTWLRSFMLMTDFGFLVYWTIVGLDFLPREYLYKDYDNEILVAWNMSFIPLDLVISVTGLLSIYFYRKKFKLWSSLCVITLSLTFCSGLQAIAFWALWLDFDPYWWTPNLFLMIYPLFFIPKLMRMSIATYQGMDGREA